MKFLADESLDGPVVDELRERGHSVIFVGEILPGVDDDAVLREAKQNNALLISFCCGRSNHGCHGHASVTMMPVLPLFSGMPTTSVGMAPAFRNRN